VIAPSASLGRLAAQAPMRRAPSGLLALCMRNASVQALWARADLIEKLSRDAIMAKRYDVSIS
jgi:hypothetical protein